MVKISKEFIIRQERNVVPVILANKQRKSDIASYKKRNFMVSFFVVFQQAETTAGPER